MDETPPNTAAPRADPLDFGAARRAMVESQLRPSGVNARFVLERMLKVPREEFVPAEVRQIAYIDRAVPLGRDSDGHPRFLPAATFQGLLIQEAAPRLEDRTLVVDSGSGYLPELLRPMVASLSVITPDEAVRGAGDGGPFSLLLVDGALEQVPQPLVALLAEDARAVTGLVERGVTRLAAGRRMGNELALLPLAELGIPVLPAFARPRAFTF